MIIQNVNFLEKRRGYGKKKDSKKDLPELQMRKRIRKGVIKRSGLAGMFHDDAEAKPLRENYRERLKRMIAQKYSSAGK